MKLTNNNMKEIIKSGVKDTGLGDRLWEAIREYEGRRVGRNLLPAIEEVEGVRRAIFSNDHYGKRVCIVTENGEFDVLFPRGRTALLTRTVMAELNPVIFGDFHAENEKRAAFLEKGSAAIMPILNAVKAYNTAAKELASTLSTSGLPAADMNRIIDHFCVDVECAEIEPADTAEEQA